MAKQVPGRRTADAYYKSQDTSVIRNSAADSTCKPGEQPAATPTSVPASSDRNTDKYYRAGGSRPVGRKKSVPPAKVDQKTVPAKTQRVKPDDNDDRFKMIDAGDSNADARTAVAQIIEQVQAGHKVRVTVSSAKSLFLRTLLDSLVTRQVITEEQYRDVTVVVRKGGEAAPTADDYFGAPKPAGEATLGGDTVEDFLAAAAEEDEAMADLVNAPPDVKVGGLNEAGAFEEDEEDDFLGGQSRLGVPTQPKRT